MIVITLYLVYSSTNIVLAVCLPACLPVCLPACLHTTQIIATGAGAALALDFVAYVRANRLRARRPVKVCYSSASLALLQFVTNTLLAESTPGIRIKTALTRHDDLEVLHFFFFFFSSCCT